jgi:hypothetical protein
MRWANPERPRSWPLPAVLCATLAVACTPSGPPVDRDVEKMESFKHDMGPEKKWTESGIELPPYPEQADLLRAYITGLATFKFFVDSKSISIGSDGVVRYTLVARSTSGADNVSYEGMRCEKSEYKVYAFGSAEATWVTARNAEWKPVKDPGINKYHYDLHRFYFCPYKIVPRSASDVVTAIKDGIPYPGPYY